MNPNDITLPAMMQAATARRYGPPSVMRLETLPVPRPAPGQILVKVEAFGVTRGDTRIRALDVPKGFGPMVRMMFGPFKPRQPIQGREFSGIVAAIGAGVTDFVPGEAVMGITDDFTLGAGAEYCVVSADKLVVRRPDSLDPVQAAGFLFGGLTATDFLIDQAGMTQGDRVLIVGATGAVGSAAVQIARHKGAWVTALASAGNLELARDLGAHDAFDYRGDWPRGPFDIILDVAGVLTPATARPMLARGGRLCRVTADAPGQIGGNIRPRRRGMRICVGVIKESRGAIERLLSIHAEHGYMPLVLPPFPMSRIVEAHETAGSGGKRGNVVVTTGA